MKLFDTEHYKLMEIFEKEKIGLRYEKEPKELWRKGRIYQCGETNNLFKAYRLGYALGKTTREAA